MCRSFLLGIKKIFRTNVVEKPETHILCSIIFFPENHVANEIMWKNVVERGRPQTRVWRMRIACWISKVTNTYAGCVIIIAFSTTTMVARTHLSVTLYVYCLSCLIPAELTDAYIGTII